MDASGGGGPSATAGPLLQQQHHDGVMIVIPMEVLLWLVGLIGCALGTITLASCRALTSHGHSPRSLGLGHADDGLLQLSGRSGVWLVVCASLSLMAFFYRPDLLAFLGMFSVCATGFFALMWTLDPFLDPVLWRLGGYLAVVTSMRVCVRSEVHHTEASPSYPFVLRPMAQGGMVTAIMSVLIIAAWFLWQHWVLNNTLAVAMCVMFVSLVRVPNLKVSAAVLGALFFYDIFWVFYSQQFFGENVMLAVATHEAQNPVAAIAEQLHIDANVSRSLQLPVKLILGPLMLGLGDIVLPGLLAAFTMRFGHRKTGRTWTSPHYITFLCGYALGLLGSFVAVAFYQVAQPALLYIVPSALGALTIWGTYRRELHELWDGENDSNVAVAERYDV